MTPDSKTVPHDESGQEMTGFTAEDLAKIFHYPAIGQLFSDPMSTAFDEFQARIVSTRDQLEKTVRHGTRGEADEAGIVIKSVNVTLDFLSSIQKMRTSEK